MTTIQVQIARIPKGRVYRRAEIRKRLESLEIREERSGLWVSTNIHFHLLCFLLLSFAL